ncbi:MAG: putative Ig domain-containing protein [Patescibacteria group bacterium]
MKKLYKTAIILLLMSSVATQAEAYYLYNIYPSSHGNNNPDIQKIKIKIKIKGDDNVITFPYLYPQPILAPAPTPTPAPIPVPVPQPNPISYYYNYYSYNNNPQPILAPYNYYYNRQPVWNQISSQTVNVGQQLQFYVSAYDSDNDYLNYSVTNLPSGATFNQYSRIFYWTPSVYQTGYYNINFRVTDNINYPVDMHVSVTVQGNQYYSSYSCYNQTYFASQSSSVNAREGQFYTFIVQAVSYNCPLTYRLVSAPAGMIINQSGVISWTPNYNQGGQAYSITAAASNGYVENTQSFVVYVEDANLNSSVYESPVQYVEKLKITDATVQAATNGDILVSWETNKPATSRVIFDLVSEANKTKDFTYDFATPDDTDLVVSHQVNLGQLEPNKTFYLRAVSKKGSEVVVGNELTFIKLPLTGTTNYNLSNLFSSRNLFWLLLLIIAILSALLIRSYRSKPETLSRLQ